LEARDFSAWSTLMSEELPKWSEVSDEEANQYRLHPAGRVAAPGTALIVVGCLGLVANLLLVMTLNAVRQFSGPVARPAGMGDKPLTDYERGQMAAPFLECCLISLPTLAIYPLVIVAGMKMRRLQTWWLALMGAILGMAPCSPVMLLGLPIGVWALVVLADPAVQTAFASHGARR
jgi:hypothetical protein